MEFNNGIVPTFPINGGNDNCFGGGGIWAFLLFALVCGNFGWGRNGMEASAVTNGFNNELFYTDLNGTVDRGFMQTANQNFGIQQSILESRYDIASKIADSQATMQSCCCDINRNIDSVKLENERNVNAIMSALKDGFCSMKMDSKDQIIAGLRDSLLQANNQLSQQAQTANLIATLRPAPVPAFIPPTGSGWGNCSSNYNNGCC